MAEEVKKIPFVHVEKCCSCIVCVDSCPVDCLALTLVPDGKKKHRCPFMPDRRICIHCGRCADDCPVEAIEMVPAA